MCKFCNQVMMQARENADFYERAKMGYDEDDSYYDNREHHVDTNNTYSSSSSSSQLSYNYTGRSYTSSNITSNETTTSAAAMETVACKVITSSKEESIVSTAVAEPAVKPLVSLATSTSATGNKKEYIKLVKKWAKSALKSLSSTITFVMDDVVLSVSEVVCGEPGCPPLEVQILVFLDDKSPPTQIRVLKALADTREEDVSSAFNEQFGKDGEDKSKGPIHSSNNSSSSTTVNITPSTSVSSTITAQQTSYAPAYTPSVSSTTVVDESSWRFRKVQRDFDDVDRELSRSIW